MKSSKTGKKQKNLYLSSKARQLLASLSLKMGISETAVVELLVREKADQQLNADAGKSGRTKR
jgi:hypothetical protein